MVEHFDERERMVTRDLEARGIRDVRVLEAMRRVPRHLFVPVEEEPIAYIDAPLPIERGQTISQPYIVARMLEALELRPDGRLLDVGTGSGYAAAVAARLVSAVYTVERHALLAATAQVRLRELGFDTVQVKVGDGTLGWPEHAPYDAIAVAAGADHVPPALLEQLVVGGHLVMPVGPEDVQTLVRITRHADDNFQLTRLERVRFVPLVAGATSP